ncbi:hypothetical protein CJF32_00009812 [Rutstroemia sp. NJR-2017a WRK4]|nr:hypothetical protein CJF32_00009812 [Rutstroemia sp. NJR-2017a WRK4]
MTDTFTVQYFNNSITRPAEPWRLAIAEKEYSPDEYTKALEHIQLAERERAFDATVETSATEVERRAAEILSRIRNHDREQVYGKALDTNGQPTGKRTQGEHFLGNLDLIDQTDLMNITKRMPKGAHLHIHFNSCLPAKFLIQQARNIDAMYIRSTLPLTSTKNLAASRISFMVMTEQEAAPLADLWTNNYPSNGWMPYMEFQQKFKVEDGDRSLHGTAGAETWLEQKILFSEEETYAVSQTSRGTQMMKGLFAYESAFRNYTRACIEDFVKDNIQYAEIRPNFMSTNSLKTNDGKGSIRNEGIMEIINQELRNTMLEIEGQKGYFGGMKVIYCTPRIFKKEQIEVALDDYYVAFVDDEKGFDLVGEEEMGNELRHFVPEFLAFQRKCKEQKLEIPFLFHCGETLQVGDKTDGNLFDAILLNAKRIGHGYAVARHPLLMQIFKEKNIAIESCPISNEVLGLTPTIAAHNLPILLANDVPCTINSDNATFYRSSLSHDFYQTMIGSESMSLYGWKQLAIWSLEHSCMDDKERENVIAEWTRRWEDFCQWIVEDYAWVESWEPKLTRH